MTSARRDCTSRRRRQEFRSPAACALRRIDGSGRWRSRASATFEFHFLALRSELQQPSAGEYLCRGSLFDARTPKAIEVPPRAFLIDITSFQPLCVCFCEIAKQIWVSAAKDVNDVVNRLFAVPATANGAERAAGGSPLAPVL